MDILRAAWLLALFGLAACGTTRTPPPAPGETFKIGTPYQVAGIWYHPQVDEDYDAIGQASWYGPQFHGRPTANGETFDMNKVTAAHPTLPLPSYVQVTNLDNGRTLKVRVNDRGPFARGRILDLSRRAAQLLGFEQQGTARVRVQLVRADGSLAERGAAEPRRLAAGEAPAGPLFIQVGSFSDYANARELQRQLEDLGKVAVESVSHRGSTFYRVRIGPFGGAELAQRVLDRVVERGFYEARIFTDRLS